ncbi:hypothetical protein [Arthrobacter sp.]|uniref:hypothetical protein n=1 Tax=Arthrobacter sp. TaxID=1667 RepID=UPI00289DAFE7|nr:hypothetical protein [Arthrobacter sp.]
MADSGKKNPKEQNQEENPDGTGPEGTIPKTADGVAAASADEASNFEPEEDTDAAGDSGS